MREREPGAGELVEAAGAGEDDQADLSVTKDGELLGLLQQPVPPLREGHLPAGGVVDPADHDLPSPHDPRLYLLPSDATDQQEEQERKKHR
ncbi:hypothetical protein B296_00035408 [Ensete ventricosum]|uniref:Uncharacterized protein n=1 Tax=Ensete ventricosum TaxID=4639 RepID=A0A426XK36_ENSVE|nr:hypothetical protein B296_00035408 [Ensete ventricosum]